MQQTNLHHETGDNGLDELKENLKSFTAHRDPASGPITHVYRTPR